MITDEQLAALRKPFAAKDVKIKMQTQPKDGETGKALCVAYIDSRDVMERLDTVIGGDWSDFYTPGAAGGVECRLTVCGITRSDVGISDDNEKEKSAYSDAFKRAAVKFGIGRFLYDLPKMWASCTKNGKYWNMDKGEMERMQTDIQRYLNNQTVSSASKPAPQTQRPAAPASNVDQDFPPLPAEPMTLAQSMKIVDSRGTEYGNKPTEDLTHVFNNLKSPAEKREAARLILEARAKAQ